MAGAKPGVHVVQLKGIKVADALIKGNKFVKWEEVSLLQAIRPYYSNQPVNCYYLVGPGREELVATTGVGYLYPVTTGNHGPVCVVKKHNPVADSRARGSDVYSFFALGFAGDKRSGINLHVTINAVGSVCKLLHTKSISIIFPFSFPSLNSTRQTRRQMENSDLFSCV